MREHPAEPTLTVDDIDEWADLTRNVLNPHAAGHYPNAWARAELGALLDEEIPHRRWSTRELLTTLTRAREIAATKAPSPHTRESTMAASPTDVLANVTPSTDISWAIGALIAGHAGTILHYWRTRDPQVLAPAHLGCLAGDYEYHANSKGATAGRAGTVIARTTWPAVAAHLDRVHTPALVDEATDLAARRRAAIPDWSPQNTAAARDARRAADAAFQQIEDACHDFGRRVWDLARPAPRPAQLQLFNLADLLGAAQ